MAETSEPTPSAAVLEADLRRLDTGLRQLKVQYDMYFAGALKRQPLELRADVERIIKRYANAPIQKYAHSFHLGTLVSRYNSLAELWGKTLRTREEGAAAAAAPAAAPPPPAPSQAAERLVAHCRVRDPEKQVEELRALYERFVRARKDVAADTREVPFDRFVRGITRQTRSLQEREECGEIELRLVVTEGKVELRARADR